ncbi:STY4528 family pathogenicity island replication protein [Achromobacter denitrificans]|uniref:STY4528 family pathogenicity island replication protein n=1 Tax=Achromobacter denitrificans TaxID=32002 RepID=UPI0023E8372F|nr:STY4528 family pathogenicity island replication protein [Achromobacter denitrificans]MDF3942075.1 STY4528 family pathogenicity island replication protein [Achromobacter denitrificans]
MADHHTRHNPLGQNALFATPASLMLDARLTPLERNGWQVLRMLRSAEGISPLANLGQLRRYLTSTPLGQRAGYETSRRVLVVLRLTGWISLVGQHRDPLTGHVLSKLYQVHESALHFQQACALDASLSALLQASIGHENNQVDRVAIHIQATLAQAPEAASIATHDQRHDDDDLPPTPPSQASDAADPPPLSGDSAGSTLVPQQTEHARHMTAEQGSTYKTYMYKKERTYRACEGGGDSASQSVSLPPCLSNAQADQQKDVLAALRRLPPQHRQEVLNELQARSQSGTVRNVVAYFFALVKRVFAGEFRLWAGRKEASAALRPTENRPAGVPRTEHRSEPTAQPASRETALAHIANIRKIMNASMNAGDIAAQAMQARGWQPHPA